MSVIVNRTINVLVQSNMRNSGTNENFDILLSKPLILSNDKHYWRVSCSNITIPYSFKNVNQYNKAILINGNTYNLSQGNFNVQQILNEIAGLIQIDCGLHASLNYNSSTGLGTYSLLSGSVSLSLTNNLSLARMLGLSDQLTLTLTSTPYTTNFHLYSYPIKNIFIRSNLLSKNVEFICEQDLYPSTVLAIVPLNSASNSYISQTTSTLVSEILDTTINKISLKISDDQSHNPVDLMGIPWFCNLKFEECHREENDRDTISSLNEPPGRTLNTPITDESQIPIDSRLFHLQQALRDLKLNSEVLNSNNAHEIVE